MAVLMSHCLTAPLPPTRRPQAEASKAKGKGTRRRQLFPKMLPRVAWRRVVLDEAQEVCVWGGAAFGIPQAFPTG